jgi:para-nitrobenzyl esterase
METYWTNFAKTGNPNAPGVPKWPKQGTTGAYIQFQQDGKVENGSGLRSAQCSIYRDWLTAQLHLVR